MPLVAIDPDGACPECASLRRLIDGLRAENIRLAALVESGDVEERIRKIHDNAERRVADAHSRVATFNRLEKWVVHLQDIISRQPGGAERIREIARTLNKENHS
jgi:hypothetical protein